LQSIGKRRKGDEEEESDSSYKTKGTEKVKDLQKE